MIFEQIFNPGSRSLSARAIAAGGELVELSLKSTLYLLRSSLSESEFQKDCQKILELLAQKGGMAQRKQILVSKRLQGGVKQYDEILDFLIESGQITVNQKGQKNNWIYSLA
jgi:hypothetical protein